MKNYVGIDIAKNDFWCCLKENKKEIKFNNTETGVNQFFSYIKKHKMNNKNTIIGLESTGAYHYRVCIKAQEMKYRIKVINPIIVNKQNQINLRRVKNDKKDSRLIRYCLINGYGYEFKETKETIKLKSLIRQRDSLVNIKNKTKRQQKAIEYKEDCIKEKIENVYQKLNQELEDKIKKLEKRLIKYQPKTQKLLQTIPGIGPITAASLVSEVTNIKRFQHAKQLAAYIGIDPRVYESGTSVKGKGYISKRGNKILRTRLYNASFVARQRDNLFKKFFEKKKSEGKPYMVAMVATMRKMSHVIYSVWSNNKEFEDRG